MKKLILLLILFVNLVAISQTNTDKNIGDTIFFDIKTATYSSNQDSFFIEIPVRIKSISAISNFDFWFKFDQTKLTYISTTNILNNLDAFTNYNAANQTLSNTSSGPTLSYVVPNNTNLMSLKFLLASKCTFIDASSFNTINTLTEGTTSKYKFNTFANASIIGGDQTNCSGSVVNLSFSDSLYGKSILSYEWMTNGLTFPNQASIQATFNNAGTYSANLTVLTADSCSYIFSKPILVAPSPIASFTYVVGNQGLVQFTNTSTLAAGSINQSSWDFGNSLTSSVTNPNHIYGANGNYTVSLIVVGSNGCSDTTNQIISITNLPTGFVSVNAFDTYFNVYPNPAEELLTITNLDGIAYLWKLVSVNGEMVAYGSNNEGVKEKVINLTQFSNGMYTLQLITNKGLLVKKISIN